MLKNEIDLMVKVLATAFKKDGLKDKCKQVLDIMIDAPSFTNDKYLLIEFNKIMDKEISDEKLLGQKSILNRKPLQKRVKKETNKAIKNRPFEFPTFCIGHKGFSVCNSCGEDLERGEDKMLHSTANKQVYYHAHKIECWLEEHKEHMIKLYEKTFGMSIVENTDDSNDDVYDNIEYLSNHRKPY